MVPSTLLKCDTVKAVTGFDSPVFLHTRVTECIRNALRKRRSKEIVGPSPTSGTNFISKKSVVAACMLWEHMG